MVSDGDRLPLGDPSLHHAALVVGPGPSAVLIAKVHFYASHLAAEVTDGFLDDSPNVLRDSLAPIGVVIGVDLNVHWLLACVASAPPMVFRDSSESRRTM
jgi:hypothetical protein